MFRNTRYILSSRHFVASIGTICNRHFSSSRCSRGVLKDKLQWSYYHCADAPPLSGVTLGKQLEIQAEKHPDKEAHIFCRQNVRLTFQDVLQQSDALAAGLLELGVSRGDRVGIWAPNIPEWIAAQYGTARAGIILVTINPAYQTSELEYALRKVGVKAIIAAENFKTQDYYRMLHKICPELDHCKPADLKSEKLPDLKSVIMISDKDFPGALKYSDLMVAGSSEQKTQIQNLQDKLQFDDPINIQFTSGTTGNPKGATLTHHNILNNAKYVGIRMNYHQQDAKLCLPVPLFHCFGMVAGNLNSITHGSTMVYPSPSFEPEAALQAVHDERCTSLYGTPTMFIDMLASPKLDKYDLTSLHTGAMAGSPCPVEIMKQTMDKLHMPEVTICYGTTENSPVTFHSYQDDSLYHKTSTIGQPQAHTEAKVIDGEGGIVPVGQEGELCIRGYCVMLNYWQDPDKTDECIGPDRWYKTGDVAVMDEDGYTQIVGRIKDVIIRGGENIYPVEVENFIYKHPKVEDVQVIGIPDDRLGEQVCACIRLKVGEAASEEDIRAFCKGEIAHFKIPHYIVFVDEYPLTVTGKIQKYKLRQDIQALLK